MARLKNGDVLLAWPLALHCITAGWTYNDGTAHGALDFRAAVGTPVVAAEDGEVALTYLWNGQVTNGDTNSYGNMVKLRHAAYDGKSLETLYAHLDRLCVKQGQRVVEGQIIGYSGATGHCFGAHLHYEVRQGGKRTNPLYWLDGDFTCANDTVRAHLGKYVSVVPEVEQKPAESEKPVLRVLTIGPVSEGDAAQLAALAERLGVKCEGVTA